MTKPSPVDPIRSQFRTVQEYLNLLGDVFIFLRKKNMRPFDWAVFSRVMGHIAVRQFEAEFKMPESVEHALKTGSEIGDIVFRAAQQAIAEMQKPGVRTVKTALSHFESDLDGAGKPGKSKDKTLN